MENDSLIYLCRNAHCPNHYLKHNASGVMIPIEEYENFRIPACPFCANEMSSELEYSLFHLKVELNLPQKAIR